LTIGRRKALDRIRAKRRFKEDPIGRDKFFADLPAPGMDPSEQTEGSELRNHVQAALKDLPSEQREVLELGYFSGLSQTEIADVTGQPLGTVKTRMRLAMQKLREPLSMHRRVTE
jgi:RNA polymerase sigma-70 factor (ECF subfamily)